MKAKELIEQLQGMPAEATVELGKVLSIDRLNDEGYTVRLDFPIIGLAHDEKTGDIVLVVDHHDSLKHFGEYKKLE